MITLYTYGTQWIQGNLLLEWLDTQNLLIMCNILQMVDM